MPSEFRVDLVFIRPQMKNSRFFDEIEREMERVFAGIGHWFVERKREDRLEIAVAEVNGLSPFDSEEELLLSVEQKIGSGCWDWLQGLHVRVIPKEEAGACYCRKRG
ncbi:hypothetical protein [Paenibacillus hamazuiensis]|uniref:hypothetical protein n=1 Tax=Paenibacillus hamazuiensis TaxID=2936508 RepID=UPI00200F888A|nr:hypothetical protein [Paenibacillus hamazuiensis]